MTNPNSSENLQSTFHQVSFKELVVNHVSPSGCTFRLVVEHDTDNHLERKLQFNVSFEELGRLQCAITTAVTKRVNDISIRRKQIFDLIQDIPAMTTIEPETVIEKLRQIAIGMD